MYGHFRDFDCNSKLALSRRLVARQKLHRLWLVKKFPQQSVCNKSDKWLCKPRLDLGADWNGLPLGWLWSFFYPYGGEDPVTAMDQDFKSDRRCEHLIYFLNCNTPARPGNNIDCFNLVWFICDNCIYPEDKTSFS